MIHNGWRDLDYMKFGTKDIVINYFVNLVLQEVPVESILASAGPPIFYQPVSISHVGQLGTNSPPTRHK